LTTFFLMATCHPGLAPVAWRCAWQFDVLSPGTETEKSRNVMVGLLKLPENLGSVVHPLPENLMEVIWGGALAGTDSAATADAAARRTVSCERKPMMSVLGLCGLFVWLG
jgi:hypothetical protein